jgi:hypothetical protein
MLPVLAIANGLDLDEVPQTLRDLNQLETTFISRRIQFMKLLALPRGRQKAVHGCVVNIPKVMQMNSWLSADNLLVLHFSIKFSCSLYFSYTNLTTLVLFKSLLQQVQIKVGPF